VNNFELKNWLPMEPSLGPPLPRFLKINWPPWIPWYKPGFTLKITNPPADSTHWTADFYSEEEGRFISSGTLALDETWECEYNPYEATDLRIRVLDTVHAITLLDAPNLGPIYSGKDYTFDCSTKILGGV